jgi:hypothetical protein
MQENDESREEEGRLVYCRNCRHYYVTWDKSFPHGCRAIGFKSRSSPAMAVREASGMDCQLFQVKGSKGE